MPLSGLLPDFTYALRNIVRNPGVTAVIALSIGLGIAANSTIFSVVNAVLLGDLPVREPGRLVVLVRNNDFSHSYPDYEDYRNTGVFEALSARFPLVPVSLASGGAPERVWGQTVTGNYFDVLGLRMAHGRGFLPSEDQVLNRDAVVVLSHGLWTRRFGADPSIVGRTVVLNQTKFTVVGVAQAGFRGVDRMLVSEFWVPLRIVATLSRELGGEKRYGERQHSWLLLEGRLKNGVSKEQALAAVQTAAGRIDHDLRRERPRTMSFGPAGKWPGQFGLAARMFLGGLMLVVSLVLAIACANVANLLLAKATARRKELSVRLALGANRARLIQQLLTESVTLSLLGATAGLAMSFVLTSLLSRVQLPLPVPLEFNFAPDARVFVFTVCLALATGVLFGLAPALQSTKPDLITALKDGAATSGRNRRFSLRNALVVVQVALSLVLLATGGLFLRSLRNAASIDLGIRPQGVLAVAFDPAGHSMDAERVRAFLAQVRRRIEALPGVESTAYVDVLPLSIGGSTTTTHPGHRDDLRLDPTYFQASNHYLQTMGIPLLKGRDFSTRPAGTKQAIIDEVVAKKLFPDREPLGGTLRASSGPFEVIGVAREAKARTIGEDPPGVVYLNMDQEMERPSSMLGVTMVVKTRGQASAFIQAVRGEIAALDPNLAVFRAETVESHVDKAFLLPRVAARMSGAFGAVGLTLASIGLFGVLSFAVRQRTREIGIRMALGAERAHVLRMVVGEGLALVGVGLLIGLPLALGLARLMSSLLYGLSPSDWVTFTAVPVAMLLIGAVAAWAPSRIASRVDPMTALRNQ